MGGKPLSKWWDCNHENLQLVQTLDVLIHKSNFKVFLYTAIQAASTLGYTTTFSYLTIQRFATLHVGMVEHVLPLMYASVLVSGKGLPVRLVRDYYLVTSLSLCTKQLVYTASIPGCLIKLFTYPSCLRPSMCTWYMPKWCMPMRWRMAWKSLSGT